MILFALLTLLVTLVPAGVFLFFKSRNKVSLFIMYLIVVFSFAFLFKAGIWYEWGWPVKYSLIIILFIVCSYKLVNLYPKFSNKINSFLIIKTIILLVLILLNINLYFSSECIKSGQNLQFPLHKGDYLIMQGGSSLTSNPFHRMDTSEIYSLDIIRVDKMGKHCKSYFSKHLDDYYIYSDTLYSPFSGKVLRTEGSIKDNEDLKPNTEFPAGNFILLEGKNVKLLIAHLKTNNIFVVENQIVEAGQPLALVGNSGNTIVPHLHLQLMEKTKKNDFIGKAVPILFRGKFYVINDKIKI